MSPTRLPDRIHGEILSPVGTTEAIFDGGNGRIAVTLPRDRVSYVGDGDAAAMAKVLGVRLSLEELVSTPRKNGRVAGLAELTAVGY